MATQIEIIQGHDAKRVSNEVNDALDRIAGRIVDVKINTCPAGPAEDQFVITTVMIIHEEPT